MAFATARDTLLDRFKAQHDLSSWSAVPISYPNIAFTPPSDAPWARVLVFPGTSETAAIGTTKYRNLGVVIVELFVPMGETDEDLIDKADDVVGFFRGATLSGVVLRTPSIQRVGEDGGFYQFTVTTPYHYDD
jgi:hypothetical protein